MRLLASLVCLLPLAACVADSATSSTADQPLVGVDGSTDSADRDCNVVLRSLERATDASGNYITNGTTWIWQGVIEISTAAAADGLAPQLEWATSASATTWQVATGVKATDNSASPGFVKYVVTLDHDAAGPANPVAFVADAYLPLTGGGRLFDHNRNVGDFDNYSLASPDFAIWGAQGVCNAPTSPLGATITFNADFTQSRAGILTPGGTLTIAYTDSRLGQCSEVQNGIPQWDVTAHLQFDSGELLTTSVRDAPATVSIPTDGAKQVSIWFDAGNVDGCHQYDSNLGANYVYALATPPQWIGLATNTMSRDSSYKCGAAPADSAPFSFDTWARVEAYETNLCFQVYQPGLTDFDNTSLWQELDTQLHYRFVGAANATTAWTTVPVNFDSFQGNNANYIYDWRTIDPFGEYTCPPVASTPTSDGMYQQITIEYYVDVNGGELPVQGDESAPYSGLFIDYPTNPWRTANCN